MEKVSYKHNELDPDMAFAYNLRKKGIFMFVSNMNNYGHLINTDSYDTKKTRPDFYEYFTNKFDWEKRYIDRRYFEQILPDTIPKQPCPDVNILNMIVDLCSKQ